MEQEREREKDLKVRIMRNSEWLLISMHLKEGGRKWAIKTESKAKLLAIESCQQISIYTGTFGLPPPQFNL